MSAPGLPAQDAHRPEDKYSGAGQASLAAYAELVSAMARDAGITASERGDLEFVERGIEFIRALPTGAIVCADDVRSELGSSPAMGSVFRRASRAGLIRSNGMIESSAPSRRKAIQRTWQRVDT